MSATALLIASAGCGAGTVDEVSPTTGATGRSTEPISGTIADADRSDETIDSTVSDSTVSDVADTPSDATKTEATRTDGRDDATTPPASSDPADEWTDAVNAVVAEAPAPGALAGVVLPDDVDHVVALFDALPDELIGGVKAVSARTPGDLAADYPSPDRASRSGFQAADLPNSFLGSYLPEPRADLLVGSFVVSDDDDITVESAGRNGGLYWVSYINTNSGEGIDGVELVYSITWGEARGRWAFSAGAPTERGRDELVAAFVAAAAEVAAAPDPRPATPDEQAARAALLTDADLGPDWVRQPQFRSGAKAFHELAISVMKDEPACAAALGWIDAEGVVLTRLLDVFAVGSIAAADGPVYVSRRDGSSDVRQTVLVFEDAGQAGASLRSSRQLGWVECATAIYDELAEVSFGGVYPGVTVSVDAAGERPLDLGDGSLAMRFELTLQAPGGGGIGVVQDISIIAAGSAATTIVQQSFGGTIDDDQIDDVIERATERLLAQFGDPDEPGS